MMQNRIVFLSSVITLIFCSCSENQNVYDDEIRVVSVEIPGLDGVDNSTRAFTNPNPDTDDNTYLFSWSLGDVIGICPSVGDQLSFSIPEKDAGSSIASFDGGGWRTKPGYTYTAYSPFNKEGFLCPLSALPVSYLGQTQKLNKSTTHLDKFDFLVSLPQSAVGDGGISFQLKRVNSYIKFVFTLPEPGTFTQLIVKSDNVKFVTKGTLDVRAGNIEVTPTEESDEYTIYLDNITTAVNEKLIVYSMLCPRDFTGSKFSFSVLTDIQNGCYKEYRMGHGANGAKRVANKGVTYTRPNSTFTTFEVVTHPASDYPYPPQDGITGTAPDFVPVGGTTSQLD